MGVLAGEMLHNIKADIIYTIIEEILDISRYIISFIILTLGLYFLIDSFYINSGGIIETYHQFIPIKSEKNIKKNFEQLCINNSDVIGWIDVKGTGINYPILAGDSNEEYLFMNEKKEYSSSGSIFIDSLNKKDFSDFNTIIYGHHMQYGGMFGDIEKYVDKSFFDDHKYGNIFYNNKDHKIEFFAFLDKADGYDFEIYDPGVKDDTNKKKYLDNLLNKAKYIRNIKVDTNDRIVLLSTCSQVITNGRYILVGKYSNDNNNKSEKTITERRGKSIKTIGKLMILLSLILIILLILIFIRRRAK